MMMFVWLNEKAQKQIKKREENWGGGKKEQEFLGDMKVEKHESSGKKYVQYYDNPMDPAAPEINTPPDFIERVTLKEDIHGWHGFRTEGLYRHEDATLMVKTQARVHSGGMIGESVVEERWQEISVSAPSLAKLRAIYSLVRQGKLSPEENWEAKQEVTKPAAESKAPVAPAKT